MELRRRTLLGLMGSAALLPEIAFGSAGTVGKGRSAIDWKRFLSRHDLVWDRLPADWDEGPFMGNGMLGLMLYRDQKQDAIRLDIGRCDVQDHRSPTRGAGYDRARLPIGHFLLRTRGKLVSGSSLRLSLHDAETRGEIVTDKGRISLRAYVHAQDMAMLVETRASAGEQDFSWEWVGAQAESPRQTWGRVTNDAKRIDPGYVTNPPGALSVDGDEHIWSQPLTAGGGTATVWRDVAKGAVRRLTLSVAHSFPQDTAQADARAIIAKVAATDPVQWDARHYGWWHDYYPQSFVSFSDTRMESFYWIQMYKLASATRANGAYMDNQGPWLQPTAWPYATWNLNVQLSYWPVFASNRVDLSQSLIRAIHDNQDRLIANAAPQYRADSATLGRSAGTNLDSPAKPPSAIGPTGLKDGATSMADGSAPETGNLPWALHDIWLAWRYTMDPGILRDTLFPVLRRTTNYYRHFLKKGPDGKLHLPPTYSPEYGSAPDLNYDLALLRWSCLALIEAAGRLNIDDPLLPEWRRILDELVEYPRDGSGFMIGAGLPLKSSHRHYSHLLMAYPLYLVNRDQPGGADIIRRSIDHWQSMPELLRGYSSTGASSLFAALGEGDEALRHLKDLFSAYLRPNTLYKESGPVIETPLSGAQSIHDMMIQSWGGTIRAFPAMPAAWPDAVFDDLRAEGAFLVSARRVGGKTAWVRVQSLAGEPFALATDIADPVATVNGKPRAFTRQPNGALTLPLAQGEETLVAPRGTSPLARIAPVPANAADINSFGINVRSHLPDQKDNSLGTNPSPVK